MIGAPPIGIIGFGKLMQQSLSVPTILCAHLSEGNRAGSALHELSTELPFQLANAARHRRRRYIPLFGRFAEAARTRDSQQIAHRFELIHDITFVFLAKMLIRLRPLSNAI